MYDSRLGRWSSMDPLAEKYYGWSPFNYCVNNPIKFIDPDGRDIWDIDEWGNVKWVNENNKHTMYALDKDGTRTGQSITINDRSIFDQLSAEPTQQSKGAWGKTGEIREAVVGKSGLDDMVSTFLFLSDNLNTEWSISSASVDGEFKVGLKTLGLEGRTEMYFGLDQIITGIHSHPAAGVDLNKGIDGEAWSMGRDLHNSIARQTKYNNNVYMGKGGAGLGSGNMWQIRHNNNNATPYNRGVMIPQQISKLLIR